MARQFRNPLLAGEINGLKPRGFHMNNSPAELAGIHDVSRPLILLSSSGTKLIANAFGSDTLYLACFRNAAATADRLIQERYSKVALLGAGSRGEFREEDQMGCAWIAASLERAGYIPEDVASAQIVHQWGEAPVSACLISKSVDYLRRTNQIEDLRFILDRVNDLQEPFTLDAHGPVTAIPAGELVEGELTRVGA
jgi:2-phosphosulfolactate phosphatase